MGHIINRHLRNKTMALNRYRNNSIRADCTYTAETQQTKLLSKLFEAKPLAATTNINQNTLV